MFTFDGFTFEGNFRVVLIEFLPIKYYFLSFYTPYFRLQLKLNAFKGRKGVNYQLVLLTFLHINSSRTNLGQRDKINRIFFILLCDALKRFTKALKAFMKLFEALQRNVKTKI